MDEPGEARGTQALRLFSIGLLTLLGQVVLLREILVAFYGSELSTILAFGFWLLWTAAGARVERRGWMPPETPVRILFLVFAAALPLSVVLARLLRVFLGAVPGAYLPFPWQILGLALTLLPAGILSGLLFQWAAKRFTRGGRTLASAYAIESAGALAGGLLATGLLRAGVQNLATALACALLAAAVSCVPARALPRALAAPALLLALAAGAAIPFSGDLDRRLAAATHPALAATRDTPYGRITVEAPAGQVIVFENDVPAFESQGTGAEEFVHLALLQVAGPRRILVLGGAAEGIVREALRHTPERVDSVELNPALLPLVAPHLPAGIRDSLAAPGVEITVADPRRFLGRHRGEPWDAILVGMPEPSSGAANRFYTREFFREAAARLSPGGVLAFRLRSAENLWTPLLTRRNAGITGALRPAFRDVLVLPGTTSVVLASRSALVRDPAVLSRRFEERRIEARLVEPNYIAYLLTNDRTAAIADSLSRSRTPPNTDARPACYGWTLALWLSRFFPRIARAGPPVLPHLPAGTLPAAAAAGLVVVFLCAALAVRGRPGARRALLAGLAGLLGMLLESALLLEYQVRRGVLYQDLGLLLTLFMAGLAAGSAAAHRARRESGPGEASGGTPLLLLAFGTSVAAAGCLATGVLAGLARTGILLGLAGLSTGALFAHASLRDRVEARAAVSPLYAADLLGGCAGSLLATLLLIPFLGLPGTALVAAALALSALPAIRES